MAPGAVISLILDPVAQSRSVAGGQHGGDEERLHNATQREEQEGIREGIKPLVAQHVALPEGPANHQYAEDVEESHRACKADDVVGEPAIEATDRCPLEPEFLQNLLGMD